MNNEKKVLSLTTVDSIIAGQLTVLRLIDQKDNITLSIPTIDGINKEDLIQVLSNKFSLDSNTFSFEYVNSPTTNGITIIHINKII